jgi:GrpB-like predicted nucleotidyltransferase (UPF0157 family)
LTPAPVPSPLGLARNTVRLAAHDPRWAALAAAECERLRQALGAALPIEHIGSTAVPGLAAKPIVDLMVGVDAEPARWSLVEPMRAAGYVHGDSDVVPGRLYFRRDDAGGLRTHQASVCVAGGRFWVEHLAFRDALRADAALAAAYLRLKRELAARFPADRIAYSEAKSGFVAGVLRARGLA